MGALGLSAGVGDPSVSEAMGDGLRVGDVLVRHAAIGLRMDERGLIAAAGFLELTLGEEEFRHDTVGKVPRAPFPALELSAVAVATERIQGYRG